MKVLLLTQISPSSLHSDARSTTSQARRYESVNTVMEKSDEGIVIQLSNHLFGCVRLHPPDGAHAAPLSCRESSNKSGASELTTSLVVSKTVSQMGIQPASQLARDLSYHPVKRQGGMCNMSKQI